MRAVEVGFDVVGFDIDVPKIKRLAAGESYVEDIPSEVVAQAMATGRYEPTDDPSRTARIRRRCDRRPDAPHRRRSESLARHRRCRHAGPRAAGRCDGDPRVDHLPRNHRGTGGRHPRGGFGARGRAGLPSRLQPGADRSGQRHLETSSTPPRSCPASTPTRCDAVQAFFDRLVDRTVPVSGTREAELTKLLENTFRHVNIALVNELAMFAEAMAIDVWEAIDAASTKPFGYMRFTPGPGVGGHCLPIDPSYLSWKVRSRLGQRSGSSSWRTTSTRTCPTTWCPSDAWHSTGTSGRSTDPGCCCWVWPTSGTQGTPASPPAW